MNAKTTTRRTAEIREAATRLAASIEMKSEVPQVH